MARALTAVLGYLRGLTLARWAAIIVVAAAVTAIALLPSRPRPSEPRFSGRTAEERRMYRVGRVAARARLRTRLATLREAGLARAGAPGSVVIMYDPSVLAGARALLDTVTRRQLAQMGTPSPDGRVVVAFATDTALNFGRYTLMPELTDGRTCISVVLLGAGAGGVIDRPTAAHLGRHITGGMFGPCAFVYAFGPPGAAARQILNENPVFALDGDWWRSRAWSADLRTSADSVRTRSFITESQWSWQWTADERACAAGRMASCRSAIRDTVSREQQASPARGVISSHQTAWSRWATRDLIAGMVREYGAPAFGRFWRADGTPEQAFLAATGRPLEEYAHHFWRETIREGYPGPGVPRGSALLAIATALAFVGGAIALAPRRVVR